MFLSGSTSSLIRSYLKSSSAGFKTTLIRAFFGLFLTSSIVYFLFQKNLLPKPIAKVVSKIFFYPTFPVTALLRLGNYWTVVDNTVILGCAPMSIFGHPQQMHALGVRGVVNMCYEYSGPKDEYASLGIRQLRLPTVDHIEPELQYYEEAVQFIQGFKDRKEKVYVHCKAGHGRGASIAFAWLLKENKSSSPVELNAWLAARRHVRKTLYKQKNILAFIDKLNGSVNSNSDNAISKKTDIDSKEL